MLRDPESCAGGREAAGEALTGAHAGRGIELRKHPSGVPTLSRHGEGHTGDSATRELSSGTAESKTRGMRGNSMRGSRETPATPPPVVGEGRSAKANCHTADVYVAGESDALIVPKKRANKAAEAAESVEGRGPTKGNADQPPTCRTQSRPRVSQRAGRAYARWSRRPPERLTRGRSRMSSSRTDLCGGRPKGRSLPRPYGIAVGPGGASVPRAASQRREFSNRRRSVCCWTRATASARA